ncbi:PepSY domain-containing protein [Streptosporangium roseum]|uniref:PepSY domain-containing protein n=1 Tax=Streptosporangium roseum TaxID=2001 RepID=UPI003321EF65
MTIGTALLAGGGGVALAADRAATLSTVTASASASASASAVPSTVTEISYQKAAQIARGRIAGGRVTKIEREYEHGYAIWKVELHKDGWEYDVYLSAESGTIVKFKRGNGG